MQQARTRLDHARAFLEVAKLVGGEQGELATPSVTTALAVLAGIAATDAACCATLGRRSRGQEHTQAVALLNQVAPDGPAMTRDLERVLAVKDDAHYGLLHVSAQRAAAAIRAGFRCFCHTHSGGFRKTGENSTPWSRRTSSTLWRSRGLRTAVQRTTPR